jgi:peptide-methionine (S)-S-oxide reductase
MRRKTLFFAALAAGTIGWTMTGSASTVQGPASITIQSQKAPQQGTQVAVLAGGCFWGMEGLFEHVKGVRSVTAGYAGGTGDTASYPAVSSEATDHAEAIRIVYDPAVVSFPQLLQVYFTVAHDPTQIDAQYPDTGRSYRSAIFPQNNEQRRAAAAFIASLDKSHAFPRPIATHLESGAFYPAEASHQQFMRRHPDHPYIVHWDLPKLSGLRHKFPSLYQ